MATTTKTTAKPADTDEGVKLPPQATSMQALEVLYTLKAAQRHAMLTVLAVEESQLFVELASRAK